MFIASKAGHAEILEVLIQSGANIEVLNSKPLFEIVASLGHNKVFSVFMKHHLQLLESLDPKIFIPLACRGGNISMLKYFLEVKKIQLKKYRSFESKEFDIQIAMAFGHFDIVIIF